jgi:hypothetical protein
MDPNLFPGFKSVYFEELQNPELQFGNGTLSHELVSFTIS